MRRQLVEVDSSVLLHCTCAIQVYDCLVWIDRHQHRPDVGLREREREGESEGRMEGGKETLIALATIETIEQHTTSGEA